MPVWKRTDLRRVRLSCWRYGVISYDGDTGVVGESYDDADVEEKGWGVRRGAGHGSNDEASGAPAVDLT